MDGCCDNPAHICVFPTELLIYLFRFLSAKNLITCRQVCKRWKVVIDAIANDDFLWEKYCNTDFEDVSIIAKKKSNSCRLWFDVYRSLALWGRLSEANEFIDEFCHSSVIADEIIDLVVLENGIIAVHKRASVVYYDIETLERSEREPVFGNFTRFIEYEDASIILGNHLHLRILRKPYKKDDSAADDDMEQEEESIFHNTKFFLVADRDVYFVNFNNEIFHCNIDNKLKSTQLQRTQTDSVMALSVYDGHLNILTMERIVYSYREGAFIKLFKLDQQPNLFDCLWRYNFIENIDWRIFFIWVAQMKVRIPDGPLRHICMMKQYGDLFFIGSSSGIVRIYYKPYTNGQLDLFNVPPVKQYNFSERIDIPVLSLHPIVTVDVVEVKGGHKVLIAMPRKIIILTYVHQLEVLPSTAVLPYTKPGPTLAT